MSGGTGGSYSGDISASETWRRLEETRDATLIDVRTRAEWSFVGIPDLSSLGKEVILLEWQSYPGMEVNPDFVALLEGELARRGADIEAPLYFICRSGVRSAAAAAAAKAAGRSACFNVAGGFEGNLNGERHRGAESGWKAEGLPWAQS